MERKAEVTFGLVFRGYIIDAAEKGEEKKLENQRNVNESNFTLKPNNQEAFLNNRKCREAVNVN